jgi:hypothetical protein
MIGKAPLQTEYTYFTEFVRSDSAHLNDHCVYLLQIEKLIFAKLIILQILHIFVVMCQVLVRKAIFKKESQTMNTFYLHCFAVICEFYKADLLN